MLKCLSENRFTLSRPLSKLYCVKNARFLGHWVVFLESFGLLWPLNYRTVLLTTILLNVSKRFPVSFFIFFYFWMLSQSHLCYTRHLPVYVWMFSLFCIKWLTLADYDDGECNWPSFIFLVNFVQWRDKHFIQLRLYWFYSII